MLLSAAAHVSVPRVTGGLRRSSPPTWHNVVAAFKLPLCCRPVPRDATERIPSSGKERLSVGFAGFCFAGEGMMMPILNSSMDFAEVNVPLETGKQNCLSNKTGF